MSLLSVPLNPIQKLRRTVSQLEYAYEDRPDTNSPDVAQWERAIAGKVNALVRQIHNSSQKPTILPPLTLCALYLHNIRSKTPDGIFDFEQFRPVDHEHAMFTDPKHAVGIRLDFKGDQFPLIPRENIDIDWWRSWGVHSRASMTPGPGKMPATPDSGLMAHSATRLPQPSRDPQTRPGSSGSAHPLNVPAANCTTPLLPSTGSPTFPTNKPSLILPRSHIIRPGARRRPMSVDPMDNDMNVDDIPSHQTSVSPSPTGIDDDKKRKTSKSLSPPTDDGRKRVRSNTGMAHSPRKGAQQVQFKTVIRTTTEDVRSAEDQSPPSVVGGPPRPSSGKRPSKLRIKPTAHMTTGRRPSGKDSHRELSLLPDSGTDKGKQKDKGKGRAIPIHDVPDSDDDFLCFPGPNTGQLKTKVQTKLRPSPNKSKTVEESDIEIVSDGETFGKTAREQARQTKGTAEQDSDVKLVPDVSTIQKVAPKPKKQKIADDSDVEIVEDPQPVPKDEKKRKKKNASTRPPATSSSSGTRRTRRGQLIIVIPPSNNASRPHQPAMPSPSVDNPAEMMDVTSTPTLATYMTEVGLPLSMKRWQSSGHSTSRGAHDVQRLHVRGVVRSMDADSSPQKRRNDVEVEDNVRGDSRHGPENIGEDGNQDETAKAGKDVAIGDDSTVDRRVDDEKEDPFDIFSTSEFSECGSVPEPPQSSDGAFEVSISQTTSSLTPWSAAAGSTGPGSRDAFGKVSSSRIPMGPSGVPQGLRTRTAELNILPVTGVETLTHHSPATSRADEMALSDVPDVAVSAIGEDVVLARQEHTIGSREESALSLALAVQAAVPGHANITVTPATADQQLAAVLKVTDTVRDTLHGTYRILASRYQQGNQTLPPDTDATSGVDQLSHRLRNLTVDLWLFGSMFDVISTCFEMLAGVLKLDNSMGLPLDRMADATRILVDLYNASGQESDRLRDMLTRPRPSGSAEAGSDVRLAAAAEDMRWPMRAMEPELAHLPAKLIDGLRGHEEDIPQLLLNAARVLAAGAQVVQNEREAMGDVVQSLAPTPAPVLTTLRSVHPDTQVFGPAFPSTLEVMDTLSRVSKQLLELEQDVTSLKQGKFIEDYLKTLGVTPASLQAVAQFTKTLASAAVSGSGTD
ncbi:hypothetical protein LXA43DRAFT_1067174 [Ganoderma leucocontextum]|nr:hypothetical protein LXA43DRAFT_1067174 [Ganoderma leucocontextum]